MSIGTNRLKEVEPGWTAKMAGTCFGEPKPKLTGKMLSVVRPIKPQDPKDSLYGKVTPSRFLIDTGTPAVPTSSISGSKVVFSAEDISCFYALGEELS